MAVTYILSLKTTRMNDVVAAIDSGGAGTMEIGTAAFGVTLAIITLSNPSGTVTGAVLTFDNTPALSTTAIGTGTAAAARFKNNGGTVIVSGITVGTVGTDIILSQSNVTTGDTVTISTATITEP